MQEEPLQTNIQFCGKTDVGRRRELNEDTFSTSKKYSIAIVADGMGGRDFGEVASSLFVSTLRSYMRKFFPESIKDRTRGDGSGVAEHLQTLFDSWFRSVNEAVYTFGDLDRKYREMGTTVAVLYQQADFAIVGHVGDSRVYRLRSKKLTLLTEDHSFINTQLKAKLITAEEALRSNHRNIITRAIGTRALVKPTLQVRSAKPGDVFLLCSDGLSDLVLDERIEEIMLDSEGDLDATGNALIDEANARGGKDNITVVLGQVVSGNGEGEPE
jgi:serine/threonine protein phosphatase PrpC